MKLKAKRELPLGIRQLKSLIRELKPEKKTKETIGKTLQARHSELTPSSSQNPQNPLVVFTSLPGRVAFKEDKGLSSRHKRLFGI